MANAGTAFWDAYATVSNAEENKRRGLIAENADKRASEEWAQKKADVAEAKRLAELMGQMNLDFSQNQLAKYRGQPTPAQPAGMTPTQPTPPGVVTAPQSPDPSAAPPPQDGVQAAPAPAAPRTAAIMAAAPPPEAAAPPPARDAAIAPPGAAPPGAAPPVTAPIAAGPGGQVPVDMKQLVRDASDHVAKLTQVQIKFLALTHPVEAAKLASATQDPAMQERMTQIATFGSLFNVSSSDPRLPGMLQEIDPGAVAGSWHVLPTDAKGNQYAQYTRNLPDGKTMEVGVNPSEINRMLVSILGPQKMVEEAKSAREEARKEKDTDSEIRSRDAAEKLGRDKFNQGVQQWADEKGIRVATEKNLLSSSYAHGQAGKASEEGRKMNAEAKQEALMQKTFMNLAGVSPQAMQDEETRSRVASQYGAVDGVMDANGMEKNASNLGKAMSAWSAASSGDASAIGVGKDGKYYYDPGTGKPLMLPYLPENLRKRLQASEKGKIKKPEARGLQP